MGVESIEIKYVIYLLEGLVMLIPNFIIVITILKQEALRFRKEYIIMVGLAFVDCCQGTALFTAGFRRTLLLWKGTVWTLFDRKVCLTVLSNILWTFSEPLSGWMLAIVSLDRLIAVTKPLEYGTLSRTYAFSMVGVVYGLTMANGCAGIYLSYTQPTERNITSMCFYTWAHVPGFASFTKALLIVGASASVVIYGFVLIGYRKHLQQIQPVMIMTQGTAEKSFQQKLTQTMGYSTLVTFVFLILPSFFIMLSENLTQILHLTPDQFATLYVGSFIVAQINPILNLFIYYNRLKAVKLGIKYTLCCKGQMPFNWALIATNAPAAQRENEDKP